jgi:hypothetical protein
MLPGSTSSNCNKIPNPLYFILSEKEGTGVLIKIYWRIIPNENEEYAPVLLIFRYQQELINSKSYLVNSKCYKFNYC